MTTNLAPPPIKIPAPFTQDKDTLNFFSTLLNTIYQMWVKLYGIRFSAKVNTTDATPTALLRSQVQTNTTLMLDACIVARRTGGGSGTSGDSAFYKLTGAYKNINGVLTGIGSPIVDAGEDQAAWSVDFAADADFAVITVTGAADNNITWVGTVSIYEAGA